MKLKHCKKCNDTGHIKSRRDYCKCDKGKALEKHDTNNPSSFLACRYSTVTGSNTKPDLNDYDSGIFLN